MKAITLSVLGLMGSLTAHAAGDTWMERNTHNTAFIQTVDVFNPQNSKDVMFRIKGPVSYSVCDEGAKLVEKMIPVVEYNREATYYVQFSSAAYGDAGQCQPGLPIPTVAIEGKGATKWLKAKAGKALILIMPQGYRVELKK